MKLRWKMIPWLWRKLDWVRLCDLQGQIDREENGDVKEG